MTEYNEKDYGEDLGPMVYRPRDEAQLERLHFFQRLLGAQKTLLLGLRRKGLLCQREGEYIVFSSDKKGRMSYRFVKPDQYGAPDLSEIGEEKLECWTRIDEIYASGFPGMPKAPEAVGTASQDRRIFKNMLRLCEEGQLDDKQGQYAAFDGKGDFVCFVEATANGVQTAFAQNDRIAVFEKINFTRVDLHAADLDAADFGSLTAGVYVGMQRQIMETVLVLARAKELVGLTDERVAVFNREGLLRSVIPSDQLPFEKKRFPDSVSWPPLQPPLQTSAPDHAAGSRN